MKPFKNVTRPHTAGDMNGKKRVIAMLIIGVPIDISLGLSSIMF